MTADPKKNSKAGAGNTVHSTKARRTWHQSGEAGFTGHSKLGAWVISLLELVRDLLDPKQRYSVISRLSGMYFPNAKRLFLRAREAWQRWLLEQWADSDDITRRLGYDYYFMKKYKRARPRLYDVLLMPALVWYGCYEELARYAIQYGFLILAYLASITPIPGFGYFERFWGHFVQNVEFEFYVERVPKMYLLLPVAIGTYIFSNLQVRHFLTDITVVYTFTYGYDATFYLCETYDAYEPGEHYDYFDDLDASQCLLAMHLAIFWALAIQPEALGIAVWFYTWTCDLQVWLMVKNGPTEEEYLIRKIMKEYSIDEVIFEIDTETDITRERLDRLGAFLRRKFPWFFRIPQYIDEFLMKAGSAVDTTGKRWMRLIRVIHDVRLPPRTKHTGILAVRSVTVPVLDRIEGLLQTGTKAIATSWANYMATRYLEFKKDVKAFVDVVVVKALTFDWSYDIRVEGSEAHDEMMGEAKFRLLMYLQKEGEEIDTDTFDVEYQDPAEILVDVYVMAYTFVGIHLCCYTTLVLFALLGPAYLTPPIQCYFEGYHFLGAAESLSIHTWARASTFTDDMMYYIWDECIPEWFDRHETWRTEEKWADWEETLDDTYEDILDEIDNMREYTEFAYYRTLDFIEWSYEFLQEVYKFFRDIQFS